MSLVDVGVSRVPEEECQKGSPVPSTGACPLTLTQDSGRALSLSVFFGVFISFIISIIY